MSARSRSRARWAALEAVWVDAAAVMDPWGWPSHAACATRPHLPWTAEPEQITPWDAETMRSACRACPVRAECAAHVAQTNVCAGWWAGTNRDPAYIDPARVLPLLFGGDAA